MALRVCVHMPATGDAGDSSWSDWWSARSCCSLLPSRLLHWKLCNLYKPRNSLFYPNQVLHVKLRSFAWFYIPWNDFRAYKHLLTHIKYNLIKIKTRFMCLFSLWLYVFTQTGDLNDNLFYLKKELLHNKILQGMEAKKFSSSACKSIIMYR